jgi:hypothetical protein
MLVLVVLSWQVWLTWEVMALRELRQQTIPPPAASRCSYLQNPLPISAERLNAFKIDPAFLLWPECTLMLWVLVPPKAQGLRDSPSNRYILAHHTGEAERKDTFRNQFAFRHSSARGRWEVETSNGKADYPSRPLFVRDGLEPGWHHFLIAWDRGARKQLLLIDGGTGGNDLSSGSFNCWPQNVADNVVVGSWVSSWAGHYCETTVGPLMIFDKYLSETSVELRNHLATRPRA